MSLRTVVFFENYFCVSENFAYQNIVLYDYKPMKFGAVL